jgi:2Fe-2S ferredoxin
MTGHADDFEDEMLDDAAAERRPNSRLSCQIRMTDELDGLELDIAPEQ